MMCFPLIAHLFAPYAWCVAGKRMMYFLNAPREHILNLKYTDMTREEHYEHLTDSFQTLSEVACAYFPNYEVSSSSIRRFRQELVRDRELFSQLRETGYELENLQLSPRQIRIIYDRWGIPGRSSRFFKPNFEQ